MSTLKRIWYVFSLGWIDDFFNKHFTSGWSLKRKLTTQIIFLTLGLLLIKFMHWSLN